MRTFLQYCLLTLIAFDVVVLPRLAFRGCPPTQYRHETSAQVAQGKYSPKRDRRDFRLRKSQASPLQ